MIRDYVRVGPDFTIEWFIFKNFMTNKVIKRSLNTEGEYYRVYHTVEVKSTITKKFKC